MKGVSFNSLEKVGTHSLSSFQRDDKQKVSVFVTNEATPSSVKKIALLKFLDIRAESLKDSTRELQ